MIEDHPRRGGPVSITATYDHMHRRVVARAEGPVTIDQIRDHLEDERLEPGLAYSELVDARAAVVELSAADIRVLVAWLRWLGERTRLGPTAVVVETDFQYGITRTIETLVEDVCEVKPFRSELDATRWLAW
jgi:hypothetical protein